MNLENAVQKLGAIDLAEFPDDLTVLDPNQLYLHHSREGRAPTRSEGDATSLHKRVPPGSYVGWFQGKSATSPNIDNVLQKLMYPLP